MVQPECLDNLRSNLHQNTRGLQRHQPQVTALTSDLKQHFPHSKYHYDYVLAAQMLYHHDCFTKLLVTMRHFCRPGTNLIWAIKACDASDLVFIEDFIKAFHTTMLAELDGVRIYLATHRATDHEDDPTKTMSTEEEMENWHTAWNFTEEENSTRQKTQNNNNAYSVDIIRNDRQCDQAFMRHQKVEEEQEKYTAGKDTESGKWEESHVHSESESFSTGNMQRITSISYDMHFLMPFRLLSQMIQMTSHLVRRFGNPSMPTYLAKRFTILWVRKSS